MIEQGRDSKWRPGVVEILAVGNELLNGTVQDGNSYWLITQVVELGGMVRRVGILPDDRDLVARVVAAVVRLETGRPPDALFITGGLGPTEDDLTLSAVAAGLGLELRRHEQAREMIRRSYDDLASRGVLAQGGMNPPREKMALLPIGAVPLVNPAGTAPGVLLKYGTTTIICFPGVPTELKSIFETSVSPLLGDIFPAMASARRSLWIACNDESILAPHLRRFQEMYPAIHVKARSGVIAENPRLEFVFSVNGSDMQAADQVLDKGLATLTAWLEQDVINVTHPAK